MSFTASLDRIIEENYNRLLSVHSSWNRVQLCEVAAILNGYAFSSKQFSKTAGMPLIRIRDVLRGATETFFKGDIDPTYLIHKDDLLVGMDGDFHTALWKGRYALLNQRVCKLTPRQEYYSKLFLAYVLPGYLSAIHAKTSAVTVKHLSSRTIADIPLPLPPRNEQNRIVEGIEELFTRLDSGVAALKRVEANLKRYKASVLKAACEGKLTEEWRQENPDVEPASELLKRILKERRSKWEEAELAKMIAKGKPPKNDKWKEKYKESEQPGTSDLPELPATWTWATPEQLALDERHALAIGPFGSNLKVSDYRSDGIPLVFVRNIRSNVFLNHDTKYVSQRKGEQLQAHSVQPNDVLVTKMGAPPGDSVVYPENAPGAIITADCIKITCDSRLARPTYLSLAVNSSLVHREIMAITRGVAQMKVSLGRFARIAIPLPPLSEQHEVIDEVEARMSGAFALDAALSTSFKRSHRLRQSILKRAFEGKLVEQDPSDEPASKLLERISEEREAEQAKSNSKPKRRKRVGTPRKSAGRKKSRTAAKQAELF